MVAQPIDRDTCVQRAGHHPDVIVAIEHRLFPPSRHPDIDVLICSCFHAETVWQRGIAMPPHAFAAGRMGENVGSVAETSEVIAPRDGLPLRMMNRQFVGIQYMRGGAALTVLFVHAFHSTLGPIGILGSVLSMFFLISGFLVVSITSPRTRPHRFILARFRRITPLYWLLTIFAATLLWGGVSWNSPIPFWHVFSYDPPLPWRLIVASLGFLPHWNAGSGTIQPVIPSGWTINLEMLYYSIFALTLFLPRRWMMPALTIAIGALTLTGLFNRPDHPALWVWTHPLGLEFLTGAWIAHAWQTRRNMWHVLGWCALVVVVIFLAQLAIRGVTPRMIMPLFGPLYGVLFVAVISADSRGTGLRVWRWPLLIGDASYSIYLVQFSVMVMLNFAGMAHGFTFGLAQFVVSLVFGITVHKLIDDPMMRLLGRRPLPLTG